MTAATRKPADDQPFDFNLDTVEAEVDLTPFRVHWQGRRWTFRHMQELDCWELVAAAGEGELSSIVDVFRAALGDEQYAEFRRFPLPQYKADQLFRAYARHCGIDPGESPGSTG